MNHDSASCTRPNAPAVWVRPPSGIWPEKITRCGDDEREDHRHLLVARGQRVQHLGALHDRPPVADHAGEAMAESLLLLGLAGVERDAFHVLAHAHQAVAEVGLHPLLAEPQRGQRTADEMREPGADDRVGQRDPDHVAGDGDAEQRDGAGQRPQDAEEADQRDDVRQQADAEGQRVVDEVADVLGDALVRVVGADRGAIGGQADAVVGAIGEPLVEEAHGQPAAPADLQPLRQIGEVDRDHDVDRGDLAEPRHEAARRVAIDEQQFEERREVLVLQRVEELAVPEAQDHRHADQQQPERQDREQQAPGGPLLLRAEVRSGQTPGVPQEWSKTAHRSLSLASVVDLGLHGGKPGCSGAGGSRRGRNSHTRCVNTARGCLRPAQPR